MKAIDIVDYRKKMKLTQEELGKILGVSGKTVSNWESTGNIPTPMRAKLEKLINGESQKRDAVDHVGRILDQMEAERASMAADKERMDADRRFYQSQIQQERDRYDRLFALFEAIQKEKVTVKV